MDVEGVDILQKVSEADPYPITPKEHGVDFLMDHRHLWLRSQRQHAIIRVRHEVIKAVRDYFDSHGFTLVDTPIFTPAACEGTTTLFEVNYFDDDKAYLTQSGQLYNEATAMAFGKVYCFGPTFRAEKSKTRRHLTEFWMVEPEMAYADLEEIKRVAEEMVVYVVGRVLDNRREELKVLERDVTKLEAVQAPFPRMSYDDAVKNLQEHGSEIQWGGDFGGADETILTQQFDRPIMVDRFPTAIKAFYMAPDPDRPEVALGVDVLAPEGYGEIIGGGQRIHDLELLLKRIEEHQLPQRSVRLVYRSAQVRHGAARRIRHGHRTLRGVDLRPGACARDHRVSAHAVPPASVNRAASKPRIAIIGAPLDLGAGTARRRYGAFGGARGGTRQAAGGAWLRSHRSRQHRRGAGRKRWTTRVRAEAQVSCRRLPRPANAWASWWRRRWRTARCRWCWAATTRSRWARCAACRGSSANRNRRSACSGSTRTPT